MTDNHNGLIIKAKDKEALSKNQQAFNRLIKRVEFLSRKKEKEKLKLDKIRSFFAAEISSLEEEMAKKKLIMAAELDHAANKFKYTKSQIQTIGSVILFLCDSAFAFTVPNEAEEAVYDRWSAMSYKEELENEHENLKADMQEELKFKYDIDIDFSDLEDTPESFARFQQQLQDALREREESNARFSERKKTKKQLEKEKLRMEEEALQLKSMRSIYISLAKALHPDTDSELENARKEDLMKRVTEAYSKKDLSTLLKLEMEWVAAEHNNVNTLSEEKLKLYVSSLKSRTKELEMDITMIQNDPKYSRIFKWIRKSEKTAIKEIKEIRKAAALSLQYLNMDLEQLQQDKTKAAILSFAEEVEAAANLNPDYDDMDLKSLLESFEGIFR